MAKAVNHLHGSGTKHGGHKGTKVKNQITKPGISGMNTLGAKSVAGHEGKLGKKAKHAEGHSKDAKPNKHGSKSVGPKDAAIHKHGGGSKIGKVKVSAAKVAGIQSSHGAKAHVTAHNKPHAGMKKKG